MLKTPKKLKKDQLVLIQANISGLKGTRAQVMNRIHGVDVLDSLYRLKLVDVDESTGWRQGHVIELFQSDLALIEETPNEELRDVILSTLYNKLDDEDFLDDLREMVDEEIDHMLFDHMNATFLPTFNEVQGAIDSLRRGKSSGVDPALIWQIAEQLQHIDCTEFSMVEHKIAHLLIKHDILKMDEEQGCLVRNYER